MDETDIDPAPLWQQACLAVAILAGFGTVYLSLAALGSFWDHMLEAQFICDGFNCVEDRRIWIQRYPWLFAATIACAIVCVASVLLLRRDRSGRSASI